MTATTFDETGERMLSVTPAERFGEPDEVANVVAVLTSKRARPTFIAESSTSTAALPGPDGVSEC